MAQAYGRVMSLVPPQAACSASKAGLMGLSCDLAQQWSGRKGIRVNALAPGYFASEMTDQPEGDFLTDRVAGSRTALADSAPPAS